MVRPRTRCGRRRRCGGRAFWWTARAELWWGRSKGRWSQRRVLLQRPL